MPRPNRIPESPLATDKPGLEWRAMRSLLPHLAEFPWRVALALSCLIAAKLAGVTLPMVLGRAVDALDADGENMALAVPLALLLGYGALRFASVAFGELRDVLFSRVSERAMRRVALRVFRHLQALDLDFHLSRRTGGLSRDIERGLSGISFLLRFMVFNIVPTLLEIAMVAVILTVSFDWRFAAISMAAVAVFIGFSVWVTEWRTQYVRAANNLDSSANTRAVDALLNYETVKLFGNERWEADKYDEALANWEKALRQNRSSLAALNAGQAFIVGAAITAMMVLAAADVTDQKLSIGDFVAVNAYMVQLFIPLNFLGFVYREIRRALTDMQRMFGLLDQQPKVADRDQAAALQCDAAEIRFEDVRFGYKADRQILHGVDLYIPAGRKLAVVGPSGSGKSTLARLLFRFYDPDGGSIRVNGRDIREFSQDSLRSQIGVVPQDTVLFNDSIAYNIAYGRPDASAAEIERVARLAHLDGFIADLPEGYETKVGERGLKLSGGEKQRIAIARALLKEPPIMIFDEATSSLDSGSEQAILTAIREVAAHRTTLVIAHRLSTITDADEIVFLERGAVMERGTHAELLAADGGYARLWRLQQREGAGTTASSGPAD